MIEGPEIVTLVFNLIILAIFWSVYRKLNLEIPFFLNLALAFILLSNFFTVIEGFILFDLFNILEHLFYLFALIAILMAVVKFKRTV